MDVKRLAALLAVAVCFVAEPRAAEPFWDSPDAYLEQPRPDDTPRVFAPGLAEKGMFLMGRVAFSPDGREFYYTQNDSWTSLERGKIMRVRYAGGRWSEPAVVNEKFISPTLSLDGRTLFFRKPNMKNV